MRKAIGVVVVIVLLVGLRFYNRSSDDKEVLADMKKVVAEIGFSAEDTAYLDDVLDREHKRAFDATYTMGGRRRAAKLDENKYIDTVFTAMIARCESDKKKDLAARLRVVHQVMLADEGK